MILLDFLMDVAQRASQSLTQRLVNSETLKDYLIRNFNMFHKDFNKRYPWPWREKDLFFQTIPNYIEGSVTVIQNQRTVTGNGTNFTSAMAGRILKLNQDDELYEILSVTNSTSLTLKVPYLGASASGASYLIWKKYYELDPEVPHLSDITVSQWPYIGNEFPKKAFDGNLIRAWQNTSLEIDWTWGGMDRSILTYSGGGTISITQDSRTLTGIGTTFLGNVFGGSRIRVGATFYNVESVDSDTQITMVQRARATASGADYSIETKNRSRIQLSSVPDPAINVLVHFFKKTYDLGNDNDEPELWEGHEHILTDVMYGYFLEKLTSEKAFAWLDVYRSKIKEAWINLNERNSTEQVPRLNQAKPSGYRQSIYG